MKDIKNLTSTEAEAGVGCYEENEVYWPEDEENEVYWPEDEEDEEDWPEDWPEDEEDEEDYIPPDWTYLASLVKEKLKTVEGRAKEEMKSIHDVLVHIMKKGTDDAFMDSFGNDLLYTLIESRDSKISLETFKILVSFGKNISMGTDWLGTGNVIYLDVTSFTSIEEYCYQIVGSEVEFFEQDDDPDEYDDYDPEDDPDYWESLGYQGSW